VRTRWSTKGKRLMDRRWSRELRNGDDVNLRSSAMEAADRIFGKQFAQPRGTQIRTLGVKILRGYWDIYRRIFVAKGTRIWTNFGDPPGFVRKRIHVGLVLEVEDDPLDGSRSSGKSKKKKKGKRQACELLRARPFRGPRRASRPCT
jgi:hypothetical protein